MKELMRAALWLGVATASADADDVASGTSNTGITSTRVGGRSIVHIPTTIGASLIDPNDLQPPVGSRPSSTPITEPTTPPVTHAPNAGSYFDLPQR